MQNKPNFRKSQMNVNKVLTKDYEKRTLGERGKNKPNSNPIKANTKPIKANKMPKQTQFKPNQTQFFSYPNPPDSLSRPINFPASFGNNAGNIRWLLCFSLAKRWLKIIHRLWKDRITYDEQLHQANQRRNQSHVA